MSEVDERISDGLPRRARGVNTRLRAEPVGSCERLRTRCDHHARALEEAARRDELLPVAPARALARGISALCARVPAHPDPPLAGRLAGIDGRYFENRGDGADDRSVIGLDDDDAVFNADCGHLGLHDLRLDLHA